MPIHIHLELLQLEIKKLKIIKIMKIFKATTKDLINYLNNLGKSEEKMKQNLLVNRVPFNL
jgi:hypothetical protein